MLTKITLVLILALLFSTVCLFAGESEQITVTTYYPSPYGSYKELNTVNLNITNSPEGTGSINVRGANRPPATGVNGVGEGSLYYNTGLHQFMYMDNTNTWKQFGGSSSGSYTHYCFNNNLPGGLTPACPATDYAIDSQGPCDTGFTVTRIFGSWGSCTNVAGLQFFLPPGNSCGTAYGTFVVGRAYLCSKPQPAT